MGSIRFSRAVQRQHHPDPEAAAGGAGEGLLNTPFGVVTLDASRQAVEGEWSYQIVAKPGQTAREDGRLTSRTSASRSAAAFRRSPPPRRTQPVCKKATAAVALGKEKPVVNGMIK